GVLRSGDLLVEIGPVTARDVQALELVVPHHLERDALAGAAPPEREVEIPLCGNLAGIEGDDDIPFLDARARARAVGHEARHHHAFVEGMGEDPEPRPRRAAARAAGAQLPGPVPRDAP